MFGFPHLYYKNSHSIGSNIWLKRVFSFVHLHLDKYLLLHFVGVAAVFLDPIKSRNSTLNAQTLRMCFLYQQMPS